MMTDDQILEVVQAHKEGKKIETSIRGANEWFAFTDRPGWNFAGCDYRVAIESLNNRWTCKVEDEAIVVNTGREDIRFDRSPGRIVLFDKLVDIHNASIWSKIPEPRKPREWWLEIKADGSIQPAPNPLTLSNEFVHVREVIE